MNSFETLEATRFSENASSYPKCAEIVQGGKDLNPYLVVRFHPHSPLFLSSAGYFAFAYLAS